MPILYFTMSYKEYRKVLPIRLRIKTPFSKKFRKFEKKYGQISNTGPNLDS